MRVHSVMQQLSWTPAPSSVSATCLGLTTRLTLCRIDQVGEDPHPPPATVKHCSTELPTAVQMRIASHSSSSQGPRVIQRGPAGGVAGVSPAASSAAAAVAAAAVGITGRQPSFTRALCKARRKSAEGPGLTLSARVSMRDASAIANTSIPSAAGSGPSAGVPNPSISPLSSSSAHHQPAGLTPAKPAANGAVAPTAADLVPWTQAAASAMPCRLAGPTGPPTAADTASASVPTNTHSHGATIAAGGVESPPTRVLSRGLTASGNGKPWMLGPVGSDGTATDGGSAADSFAVGGCSGPSRLAAVTAAAMTVPCTAASSRLAAAAAPMEAASEGTAAVPSSSSFMSQQQHLVESAPTATAAATPVGSALARLTVQSVIAAAAAGTGGATPMHSNSSRCAVDAGSVGGSQQAYIVPGAGSARAWLTGVGAGGATGSSGGRRHPWQMVEAALAQSSGNVANTGDDALNLDMDEEEAAAACGGSCGLANQRAVVGSRAATPVPASANSPESATTAFSARRGCNPQTLAPAAVTAMGSAPRHLSIAAAAGLGSVVATSAAAAGDRSRNGSGTGFIATVAITASSSVGSAAPPSFMLPPFLATMPPIGSIAEAARGSNPAHDNPSLAAAPSHAGRVSLPPQLQPLPVPCNGNVNLPGLGSSAGVGVTAAGEAAVAAAAAFGSVEGQWAHAVTPDAVDHTKAAAAQHGIIASATTNATVTTTADVFSTGVITAAGATSTAPVGPTTGAAAPVVSGAATSVAVSVGDEGAWRALDHEGDDSGLEPMFVSPAVSDVLGSGDPDAARMALYTLLSNNPSLQLTLEDIIRCALVGKAVVHETLLACPRVSSGAAGTGAGGGGGGGGYSASHASMSVGPASLSHGAGGVGGGGGWAGSPYGSSGQAAAALLSSHSTTASGMQRNMAAASAAAAGGPHNPLDDFLVLRVAACYLHPAASANGSGDPHGRVLGQATAPAPHHLPSLFISFSRPYSSAAAGAAGSAAASAAALAASAALTAAVAAADASAAVAAAAGGGASGSLAQLSFVPAGTPVTGPLSTASLTDAASAASPPTPVRAMAVKNKAAVAGAPSSGSGKMAKSPSLGSLFGSLSKPSWMKGMRPSNSGNRDSARSPPRSASAATAAAAMAAAVSGTSACGGMPVGSSPHGASGGSGGRAGMSLTAHANRANSGHDPSRRGTGAGFAAISHGGFDAAASLPARPYSINPYVSPSVASAAGDSPATDASGLAMHVASATAAAAAAAVATTSSPSVDTNSNSSLAKAMAAASAAGATASAAAASAAAAAATAAVAADAPSAATAAALEAMCSRVRLEQMLLAHVPVAVMVLGLDGRVVYQNGRWAWGTEEGSCMRKTSSHMYIYSPSPWPCIATDVLHVCDAC